MRHKIKVIVTNFDMFVDDFVLWKQWIWWLLDELQILIETLNLYTAEASIVTIDVNW